MTDEEIEILNLIDRAKECAEGRCTHARDVEDERRTAGRYRYGIEDAIDYLDDRDGITPEVAEELRGILQRTIEPRFPA